MLYRIHHILKTHVTKALDISDFETFTKNTLGYFHYRLKRSKNHTLAESTLQREKWDLIALIKFFATPEITNTQYKSLITCRVVIPSKGYRSEQGSPQVYHRSCAKVADVEILRGYDESGCVVHLDQERYGWHAGDQGVVNIVVANRESWKRILALSVRDRTPRLDESIRCWEPCRRRCRSGR